MTYLMIMIYGYKLEQIKKVINNYDVNIHWEFFVNDLATSDPIQAIRIELETDCAPLTSVSLYSCLLPTIMSPCSSNFLFCG